jgi:hypothetical protein
VIKPGGGLDDSPLCECALSKLLDIFPLLLPEGFIRFWSLCERVWAPWLSPPFPGVNPF